MSTIKDLIDLVTQLNESTQDRKFASELREIQRMIFALQSEQSLLHEKNIELLTENSDLKQKLLSYQQGAPQVNDSRAQHSVTLSKDEENILQYLATLEEATARQVQQAISLSFVKTEYWLNELDDNEMISASYFVGGETKYYLSQKGRKYLITNDLI